MPIPVPGASLIARPIAGKVKSSGKSQSQVKPSTFIEQAQSQTCDDTPTVMRPTTSRPLSFHKESEGSKRRSLLPQLGQPRYTSRTSRAFSIHDRSDEIEEAVSNATKPTGSPPAATVSEDTTVPEATERRRKARSMYQISTAMLASRGPTFQDESTVQLHKHTPGPTAKPSGLRASGLNRSRSLRRPDIGMQATKLDDSARQAGKEAINTTAAASKEQPKPATALSKPRSLLTAPKSNLKSQSNPTEQATSGTRSSARISALNRLSSTKTSSEPSKNIIGKGIEETNESGLPARLRKKDNTQERKTTNRPAFSTLQQHFTPRKGGKAPTSTFLQPSTGSTSNSLSADLVSIQAELLQLHLMHEASAGTNQLWNTSAKRNLHRKFEEVAGLYIAMLAEERASDEHGNIKALLAWREGNASPSLIEHIQILSELLHDLPPLMEPGGRLQLLVNTFEPWMLKTRMEWSARQNLGEKGGPTASIDDLADSWKVESDALTRKFDTYVNNLNRLPCPETGSGIACIVDICRTISNEVLHELRIMRTIESDIVSREKSWIEYSLKAMARDGGSYVVENGENMAHWRS